MRIEPPRKLHDQATTLLGAMQGIVSLCIAWGLITHAQSQGLSDPKMLEGLAFMVTGLLSAIKGYYTNK
jgi:hypothetical protein